MAFESSWQSGSQLIPIAIAVGQSVVRSRVCASIKSELAALPDRRAPRPSGSRGFLRNVPRAQERHRDSRGRLRPVHGNRSWKSVRRIKTDPSKIFYIRLRPGMPGILGRDAVGTTKVSSDVACRKAKCPRRGNKDMGDVLADASPERKGFDRGSLHEWDQCRKSFHD